MSNNNNNTKTRLLKGSRREAVNNGIKAFTHACYKGICPLFRHFSSGGRWLMAEMLLVAVGLSFCCQCLSWVSRKEVPSWASKLTKTSKICIPIIPPMPSLWLLPLPLLSLEIKVFSHWWIYSSVLLLKEKMFRKKIGIKALNLPMTTTIQ